MPDEAASSNPDLPNVDLILKLLQKGTGRRLKLSEKTLRLLIEASQKAGSASDVAIQCPTTDVCLLCDSRDICYSCDMADWCINHDTH